MSYPLQGVNFTDQAFTPTSDCAIWARCISDGILSGMAISAAGSSLSVGAGWLMCGGKQLQLPAAITVPVTEALSGLARLVVTVDLSKTATETTFAQAQIDLQYEPAFADLVQQDLTASGTVYQMVLCTVSLGSGGITGIVSTCGYAHGKALGAAVTLTAAGWADNRQTVRCDGATASNNVRACGAPASLDDYLAAGIRLVGQAPGALTFSCAAAPEVDIVANVLIQ